MTTGSNTGTAQYTLSATTLTITNGGWTGGWAKMTGTYTKAFDPNGTWVFNISSQTATATISGNTWTLDATGTENDGSGSFSRYGNTGTLRQGNVVLGTATLTSATTMQLVLTQGALAAGSPYTGTKQVQ